MAESERIVNEHGAGIQTFSHATSIGPERQPVSVPIDPGKKVILNGKTVTLEEFTSYKHRVEGKNGVRVEQIGPEEYRTRIYG